MDARGAGRDRDVHTIVDEHARAGPRGCFHDPPDERGQRRIGQVALAHLDDIRVRFRRPDGPIDEIIEGKVVSPSIGDAVDGSGGNPGATKAIHGRTCPGPGSLLRAFDRISEPSSARPASAVITPTPVTPPRAYGLFRNASSAGRASANRLCSHTADHGATTRMNPASRKYAANSSRLRVRMISLRSARAPGARRAPPRHGNPPRRTAARETRQARAPFPRRTRGSRQGRTAARAPR